MPSTGLGRAVGATVCRRATLVARPDVPSYTGATTPINDYFWPAGPPAPVAVPLCWLTGTVSLRQRPAQNKAVVTGANSVAARAVNRPSVATYTATPFTATLDTACTADAGSLANWVVAYRSEPRVAIPQLVFNLLMRTDSERRLLLGVRLGRRITLTGTPAEFPAGANSLIVAGIGHTVGVQVRTLTWTLSPVDGAIAGTPGPWFRIGSSRWDGPDVVLF